MAQKFRLKNAEEVRNTTTMQMQREIQKMYRQLYKDVSKKVANMNDTNYQKQNLIILKRDIKKRIEQLNKDIKGGVIRNMTTVCNEVVVDIRDFLKQCGFKNSDIHNAFQYVPDMVVRNIINGNIYQDDWSLSAAIWGYNKKTQDGLDRIISIGTAQGKSALEIAKELESYVEPSAQKKSRTIQSWRIARQSDVEAGRAQYVGEKIKDTFYFGKVDYNAQRLARTMISHAYQQSFENVNRNDPFVIGYRWLTSNFHGRVCDICRERAETDQYGLGEGVFPKDALPLDHPNGMCTFEAVMPDDMKTIAQKIGMWYNSPVGTYPDIDRYVLDFVQ